MSLLVKEFLKSVKIWQSYCPKFGGFLFLGTQCSGIFLDHQHHVQCTIVYFCYNTVILHLAQLRQCSAVTCFNNLHYWGPGLAMVWENVCNKAKHLRSTVSLAGSRASFLVRNRFFCSFGGWKNPRTHIVTIYCLWYFCNTQKLT